MSDVHESVPTGKSAAICPTQVVDKALVVRMNEHLPCIWLRWVVCQVPDEVS